MYKGVGGLRPALAVCIEGCAACCRGGRGAGVRRRALQTMLAAGWPGGAPSRPVRSPYSSASTHRGLQGTLAPAPWRGDWAGLLRSLPSYKLAENAGEMKEGARTPRRKDAPPIAEL